MNKIGEKIRKLRDLRGLSQENIAKDLGIGQGSYSKIEAGETDLQYSRLEQIAQVLKTTVGEIVNFDEERILNNYYNGDGNNTNVNHGNIYHDKLLIEEVHKTYEKVIKSYELHIDSLKSDNMRLHELFAKMLTKS
jgi:transcriptional regulator with XRE-family HTH domain